MRSLVAATAVLMCCCAPAPPPKQQPPSDLATQAAYEGATRELATLARDAAAAFAQGRTGEAAALILKAQPVQGRVLAVPRPTLPAMEAASSLDHLYGTMLLANRHFEWARLLFRKNQLRWQNWRPQTEDTARRRREAEAAIAECDRRMAQ